jgi:hypothetical protein
MHKTRAKSGKRSLVNRNTCLYAPAGADCILCTKERAEDPALEIAQVIECLHFMHDQERANILLYMIVTNPTNQFLRFRILHMGGVAGGMRRCSRNPSDLKEKMILDLYSGRIIFDEKDETRADFYPRLNCTEVDTRPLHVGLCGPGIELPTGGTMLELHAEIRATEVDSPFTSFLIPHSGLGIEPATSAMFVLELTFEGAVYRKLVGKYPSVDSCTRIKRALESDWLPGAKGPHANFYNDNILPAGMLLAPKMYDVVILQQPGAPLVVRQRSLFVTPVLSRQEELAKKVLWFLGQTEEFYLRLEFSRAQNVHPLSGVILDWQRNSPSYYAEVG